MSSKNSKNLKVLFASSETFPLIKTGGLADVSSSLPQALQAAGCDVRLIMPAYRQVLGQGQWIILRHTLPGFEQPARILQGLLPGSSIPVWLVDIPALFDRDGGPYVNKEGHDWDDNAQRFADFARVVADIASKKLDLSWEADVVHCNDWQTGLVPALLSLEENPPPTIFTIHNLAYRGIYPTDTYYSLNLPEKLWQSGGIEFYGQASFLKAGLHYADHITTVSPSYAEEIMTAEFGHGLEGLLSHRSEDVSGILNGADYNQWDPATDEFIGENYSLRSLTRKNANKRWLQQHFKLSESAETPLLGLVGRFAEQKGIDLILDIMPQLLSAGVQIAVVGEGDKTLGQRWLDLQSSHPQQVGLFLGYSEKLAHCIEAGADMFLMPSRYEPCGLNQIYSLKYGTIPVVRETGGLADTVVNMTAETLASDEATGFSFKEVDAQALLNTLLRAVEAYKTPEVWQRLMTNAMNQDFSWQKSATDYITLYRALCK